MAALLTRMSCRSHDRRAAVAGGLALAVALAGTLGTADIAAAKPKKKAVSNGCTVEQIQAPSAAACIDQLEQDVIDGVAYPHALYCDEMGVYCCQGDGTRTFGCKKVAAASLQPRLMTPVAPDLLQKQFLQQAPQ